MIGSVMVTGHRPTDLSGTQINFAKSSLVKLAGGLQEKGMTEAISGMALGADTWWALTALALDIPLAAYIPFQAQASDWMDYDKVLWSDIRRRAQREVLVSRTGSGRRAPLFHARNDRMINDCDVAIAVWCPSKTTGGTASTVKKLRATTKPILIVDLDRLEIHKEN